MSTQSVIRHPLTFFARYHISDLKQVQEGIKQAGLEDHFFLDPMGRNEHNEAIPNGLGNGFTVYTDLIRPDAMACVKQYENLQLRTQLGLFVAVKV
jgi:hypothetical protein